jgi:hypothetical protein
MGFTRRFSSMPPIEVLTEIEGTVTVDETPTGQIAGVSQGVACLVGEFADVTLGVQVSAIGAVTTLPQPTEMFGAQDQLSRLGGWDETIGEFGGDMGNGYVELISKAFSRLVVVVINLASSNGARLWRKLPTSTSATNPSPVVPVTAATVPAGREFKSASNRVRIAKRIGFSSSPEYKSATDGAVTAAGGPAVNQAFGSPAGGLSTVTRPDGTFGVQVGDIVVIGVIGGAAGLGANADTYRVQAATDDTHLQLEKLDGSAFNWTTASALPWRIHVAGVADTGGAFAATGAGGYLIPCRPLDATIAASTSLAPTIVPPAATATYADPLSGLTLRTDPTVGLVYTAAVQAPNAATNATLVALYATAIDALLVDDLPEREVNLVWAARASADGLIRSKLENHVLVQKLSGVGRIAISNPPLDQLTFSTVVGDAAPGVGAVRAEEQIYNWPGVQVFIAAAVGVNVKGADGLLYKDGVVDVPSTSWGAAIMSQLPPERNPGQSSDPVKTVMSPVLGIQRGVSGLGINEYKRLLATGVMAPRKDRTVGMVFQSGVTTSLIPGQKDINRRRFSFYIEDSVAAFLDPFAKEPMAEGLKDRIFGAIHDFLGGLLAAARCRAIDVDGRGGNTAELSDAGVYVVRYKVEMIQIAKTIVQIPEIGLGVIQQQASVGNGTVSIQAF